MRPGEEGKGTWRGWANSKTRASATVTSARLDPSVRPQNRLFPKTRSWFALDSPLELLSPLSVLRVLFVLAAVAWPLVGLTNSWPIGDRLGVLVVSAVTLAVWLILLLGMKEIARSGSKLLTGYWVLAIGVLIWCAHGTGAAVVYALFLTPIAAFAALFLGNRAVVAQQGAVVVVLWAALSRQSGVVRGLGFAFAATIALSVIPATVLLLARSARRHDTVDPDTGIPNGFGLAEQSLVTGQQHYLAAAVVLEGISTAREALGYQVGTELLRRAVEDLGQVLDSDAVIGRVAGDELIVMMALEHPNEGAEGATAPDGGLPAPVVVAGHALAETLIRAIAAGRYRVGDIEVSMQAHVGLAASPWDGTDVSEVVRRASLSGTRAAERGVSVVIWDESNGTLTAEDLAMLADLRQASDRGELWVAYQPQVASATGKTASVEALMRWSSPTRGSVAPGRFIPLAERTGLIHRLTEWVVVEALDAQERWRSSGLELPVSVNLSAKSFADPGLALWILEQLDSRGLPTSCLTIEVTETVVADPDEAIAMLDPLHRRGVRVSIDDFGTGFTSLAMLPTLPVDELKVDQGFVLRSVGSVADAAIVRTVAELAHRLGLQVVAEGVETEEIAALMRTMGIDLLQGYHFARPMAEPDLFVFLTHELTGGPIRGEAAQSARRNRRRLTL
jgi:EAL domain-containing protein (putative c-di-GMP-specific phosphodiesterase class I)/GGDEF domain-containing protein